MNSVKHGFPETIEGKILIETYEKRRNIIIHYRDDGGSGLGTHLVYNLVTSSLKGKITVKSPVGKGLAYLIKFPIL